MRNQTQIAYLEAKKETAKHEDDFGGNAWELAYNAELDRQGELIDWAKEALASLLETNGAEAAKEMMNNFDNLNFVQQEKIADLVANMEPTI